MSVAASNATPLHVRSVTAPANATTALASFTRDAHALLNVFVMVLLWVGIQGLVDTFARDELQAKSHRYALYGVLAAITIVVVLFLGIFDLSPLVGSSGVL